MATRRRKTQAQWPLSPNSSPASGSVPKSSLSLLSAAEEKSRTDATAAAIPVESVMNKTLGGQPVWVGLAMASGACAAINGVFAKFLWLLLVGLLTRANYLNGSERHVEYSRLSKGLSTDNNVVNVSLRASFFGLNLLFNGVMWGLFTAALTKGSSTTRVSIVNVSANFFLTAILGWLIFSEKLPLQWWMGATLLACGNIVIGMREEDGDKKGSGVALDADDGEEDLLELDEAPIELRGKYDEETQRIKRGNDIDDPI